MIRTLAFLVVTTFTPVQALALSCLPWQVEDAFTTAVESPDLYVIVRGKLSFAQSDFPQVDWDRQHDVPPVTRIKARLKGKSLGHSGFANAFSRPVTFVVSCAGPWCPSATSGSDVLAFVKIDAPDYEISLGACGGMIFQQPDRKMIARVTQCMADGKCTAPDF